MLKTNRVVRFFRRHGEGLHAVQLGVDEVVAGSQDEHHDEERHEEDDRAHLFTPLLVSDCLRPSSALRG